MKEGIRNDMVVKTLKLITVCNDLVMRTYRGREDSSARILNSELN
jgi:hypothetical protein